MKLKEIKNIHRILLKEKPLSDGRHLLQFLIDGSGKKILKFISADWRFTEGSGYLYIEEFTEDILPKLKPETYIEKDLLEVFKKEFTNEDNWKNSEK